MKLLTNNSRWRKINEKKIRHIFTVYDFDWDILMGLPYMKKKIERGSVLYEQWGSFPGIIKNFNEVLDNF
jgi:hypothetical protein